MKIALIGYGKMGKMIHEIIRQNSVHEIVDVFSSSNKPTVEKLKLAEVAIEFTQPETAVHHIKMCMDAGVPVVCGSTGWLSHLNEVEQYCSSANGSLIYASNFSIGVNIFFELNKKLAALMQNQQQYKIRMEEIHHTEKKDAPSGTAISLANDLIKINESKSRWVNHETENKNELPVISIRKEAVTGTHIIQYQSREDLIEIKHHAFNREGFAKGALLAAELISQHKGVHSFTEILHL